MDYGFLCKLHPTDGKRKGFHVFLMAFQQPGCWAAAGLLVLPSFRVYTARGKK
jgi:hypothetical protein